MRFEHEYARQFRIEHEHERGHLSKAFRGSESWRGACAGESPCARRGAGDYLVYSAGPDRKDDGGALTYDPTNGTISAGDMIVRIPRQRRYPFPSGPVHAASAAEFFRQFPHGLPGDAFSSFQHPLKVLDSSGMLPVIIFSERPGNEEQPLTGLNDNRLAYEAPGTTATLPADWRLSAPYDPTNGSYSQGDLFLELPK